MSELQSFFEPTDQSQTRDDLPDSVSTAARDGDLDTVRRWLAAGGSPNASKEHQGTTRSLLSRACATSRPSTAEVVRLLCAAGANPEGSQGMPLELASKYGAEAAVRHLLRAGASVHGGRGRLTPIILAVAVNSYANAPRLDVVVLQSLCAKGRASPPPVLARLFPTSTRSQLVPREISWRILSYWRTDRDP